jgi:ArsR family transcriptional regulator, virulence genes transcriptional regulator
MRTAAAAATGASIKAMTASARLASAFLKSLASERRLLILCHLAEGERSVSELEALLGMRQAAVSQHLARLRADHLVRTRRDGKAIHYALASEEVREIIALLYRRFCAPPTARRRAAQGR